MKNAAYLLVLLFLLGLNGCKNRNESSVSKSDSMETPAEMLDAEGHDEPLGNQTLTGTLYTDKGATPRVSGVFISQDYFEKDGKDWFQVMDQYKGKKVEVKGEVVRHWCGPMEQCLSQGYMDWMREVEYVKILD